MNDLDLIDNTRREVAPIGPDPFAAYGAQQQSGTFMSFSRVGEFEAGQDKEMVPFGTRLVANMPGLRQGWRCWIDKKLVDDRTDLLGVKHARRDELGDTDEAMWERDKEGKPRDPWSFNDLLEMSDGENSYLFATRSKGGRGAIQKLCAAYARERRMRPGMLPIITLGRDSYQNKTYGKTFFPVFEIVGWTDADNPHVDDSEVFPVDGRRRDEPGQRAANPTREDGKPPADSGFATATSPSDGARRATRF